MPEQPPDDPPLIALPTQRVLAVAENVWSGRDAVEDYLDRLNRASQVASRRVHDWEPQHDGAMGLSAVLMEPLAGALVPGNRTPDYDAFMGEFRGSFGIELIGADTPTAEAPYTIGLPLAGAVTVTTRRGSCTARAGEGIVIDPAEVISSRLTPGMHFVEFCLAKHDVARLSGRSDAGAPRFALHVREGLAQRLLFMAVQAAGVLQAPDTGPGSRMMFQRWCEMIALTLLHEQPFEALPERRDGAATPGVRRALDYIHAHADSEIGLADIAEAAHLSVSSLLRHFNTQLGMSPYSCLKTVRLDRARRDLLADSPEAVRDVALRWGFQNAGKFSQTYRAHFGELPSQTRARRPLR